MLLASMNEIGGVTAIKSTAKIGLKSVIDVTLRCPHILIWMCGDVLVEQQTVGSSDIFHISHILQTSFNLKRHCTGLDELC